MLPFGVKDHKIYHLSRIYCTITHAFLAISVVLLMSQAPNSPGVDGRSLWMTFCVFASMVLCLGQWGEKKKCPFLQYPYFLVQFYTAFVFFFFTLWCAISAVYYFGWSFKEHHYAQDAYRAFIIGSLSALVGTANFYFGYLIPLGICPRPHPHSEEKKEEIKEDKLEMPY